MFYGTGCRAEVAKFMSTHITHMPIHPDRVVPAAGVSGALDLLFFMLCDVDDAVLVVAPGYNGLRVCAATRNGVRTLIAQLDEKNDFQLNVSALHKAWLDAGGENSSIRCCVITSPMNPTGEVLSKETIMGIVSWARARGIHSVFDEIFALSCFNPDKPFVSVLEALDNDLGDDVHVVWGLSKDFCASGLRMGVIVSHNLDLIQTLWPSATLSGVSRHTQFAIGEMLSDNEFCVEYVAENRRRLSQAYKSITELLDNDGVGYARADAGAFVYINLSPFLKGEPSKESELALFRRLVDNAGVILTPSTDAFSSAYGWFRLCYSSITEEGLREAWRRIRKELIL